MSSRLFIIFRPISSDRCRLLYYLLLLELSETNAVVIKVESRVDVLEDRWAHGWPLELDEKNVKKRTHTLIQMSPTTQPILLS